MYASIAFSAVQRRTTLSNALSVKALGLLHVCLLHLRDFWLAGHGGLRMAWAIRGESKSVGGSEWWPAGAVCACWLLTSVPRMSVLTMN